MNLWTVCLYRNRPRVADAHHLAAWVDTRLVAAYLVATTPEAVRQDRGRGAASLLLSPRRMPYPVRDEPQLALLCAKEHCATVLGMELGEGWQLSDTVNNPADPALSSPPPGQEPFILHGVPLWLEQKDALTDPD